MKLGVIIYSNDLETIFNAFDFAAYGLKSGDQVEVCLLGKGVEAEFLSKTEAYAGQPYKLIEQMQSFVESGGEILASAKCLAARELGLSKLCTSSTVSEIYEVVKESDKVVTF